MSKKLKHTVKLDLGEAIVVAPVEDWGFVIDACKMVQLTADLSPDSRKGWKRVIENMEFWINQSEVETDEESS